MKTHGVRGVFSTAFTGCLILALGCTGNIGGEQPGDDPPNYYRATLTLADAEVGIAGGEDIGVGLQAKYVVTLGSPAQSTATLRIETEPGCQVARHILDSQVGDTLELPVYPGSKRFDIVVHGASPGICTVTPSVDDGYYTGVPRNLNIRPSSVALSDLSANYKVFGNSDNFRVIVGLANATEKRIASQQLVGLAAGMQVEVCASRDLDESGVPFVVGVIENGEAGEPDCRTMTIYKATSKSGTFSFRPESAGESTVAATSASAALPVDNGSKVVTVAGAALNMTGTNTIGVGLQDRFEAVFSSAPADGSVVTVETTGGCVASADSAVSGSSSTIVDTLGKRSVGFWLQGTAIGSCAVTLSSAGFEDHDTSLDIEYPAVQIANLSGSQSTQSGNDPFDVLVGVISNNLQSVGRRQDVAPGSPLVAEACSDDSNKAEIEFNGQRDECVDFEIAPGNDKVELVFVPKAEGTVIASIGKAATGPVLAIPAKAAKQVSITGASLAINGVEWLGAGLQDQYTLKLSDRVATPTTVTISSATGSFCTVSELATEAGSPSIEVTIPANKISTKFTVHAARDIEEPCELIATSGGGFGPAQENILIKTPSLKLVSLKGSVSFDSGDEEFAVEVGVANQSQSRLRFTQAASVMADGSGFPIVVCAVDPVSGVSTAGQIRNPNLWGICRITAVPGGTTQSADADLAFVPHAAGSARIFATGVGVAVVPIDHSEKIVEVNAGSINLADLAPEVGTGLLDTFTLRVSPKAPFGGMSVTLQAGSGCSVAEQGSTAQSSLVVEIAEGESSAKLELWGGAVAPDDPCSVTASTTTAGYAGTSDDVDVVTSALRTRALDTSTTALSAADGFRVEIGVPSANGLKRVQAVNPAAGPLAVDVCDADNQPGLASLSGGVSPDPDCVRSTILVGNSSTDDDVFTLTPMANGDFVVEARATGLASDRDVVSISSVSLKFAGLEDVGVGLMTSARLVRSSSAPTASAVVIEASPGCLISETDESQAAASLALQIDANRSDVDFWVHGLGVGSCQLEVTASSIGYPSAEIGIVYPALKIDGLDTTTSVGASDDSFRVQVGRTRVGNANLVQQQAVSSYFGDLAVEVSSSDPAVATLVSSAGLSASVIVSIAVGDSSSDDADVALRALSPAATLVEAVAPGHITTDAGQRWVVVSE